MPQPLTPGAIAVRSAASATVFGGTIGPGVVAQLDTTQNPPVVVDVYNWVDTTYMAPPAWINITGVMPAVTPGCTYSNGVWTYPAVPESMLTWAHAQIGANVKYIAIPSPNQAQQNIQLDALTAQMNRILIRRVGGL